ncbi:prolyl aminopeptidase [Erysipelothrix sp. HDW6A]|uniref:prolyl aminopeptidase n=1 Tax=Erysipelothrix sp. HDW6A TaxID=2714928 RepID=UPI0014096EA5|nr:prolyl aminopeptidase [Erysipelothrix sp. HDW6A]QIK58167.1 prolyl aminopeptidase [Erysipelothrix sp. HDW6A]
MNVDTYLKTEDGQELAIYTRGNPDKPAVIFLHGGPGGQISEKSFDFFNLNEWYVIAFDQRGCGGSKPFATLINNTPQFGVEDINLIRKHFNIETWTVFGGSYGSTLALAYAIQYPQHVDNLVLRGIFLGREEDVRWLYQEGASYFYPQEHERFKAIIKEDKRNDLVQAYYEIFTSDNDSRKREAAKAWADWEGSVVLLVPNTTLHENELTDADISIATLECHFFANKMFWNDDNYLLNNIQAIQDIPTTIVHGRYDVDCRLSAAHALHKQLNNSKLIISESSGHSPYEPASFEALQSTMRELENYK